MAIELSSLRRISPQLAVPPAPHREVVRRLAYRDMTGPQLEYLDGGGILHITDYWGSRHFLDNVGSLMADRGLGSDFRELFETREVPSMESLGAVTKLLKLLVHNHAFAMTMTPLIEALGCDLTMAHIDCGVLRYQLLNNLRAAAEASGFFEPADFARIDPRAIAEIFGYDKLSPHRDVRWPHIRILGFWMTLTDLEEGEALTMYPEVFAKPAAIGDPAKERFPTNSDPNTYGLGRALSPAMKAGDLVAFHAGTVHSSPPRQVKTVRGSIDFRVAFPCFDDFNHYKWTFVQARNLVHNQDKLSPVDPAQQRLVIDSMMKELTASGSGAGLSMYERRIAMARSGEKLDLSEASRLIADGQFCPDTSLWMLDRADSRAVQELLLSTVLSRSNSYFWLFQAYQQAKLRAFPLLTRQLKLATEQACRVTKLPIVNVPLPWPGPPRELMPEDVLRVLAVEP